MGGAGRLGGAFQSILARGDAGDERAFLPAALEVLETPPSPTGRLLGLIIMLFFTVAVIWAFVGKVDVLATAPGRLLPAGDVKVIQPLDPGVVRAIRVEDGDHVRAGQVLVELDPTQDSADSVKFARDLAQARLDVARLTALRDAASSGRAPQLVTPDGAPSDLVEQARAAMIAQADQQTAKLADLSDQISQKDAEIAEVGAQIDQINAALPMLEAKEQIHHDLTARGYGTSLAYLDAQQQVAQARHELLVLAPQVTQDRAERASLVAQREGARSQYLAELFSDLRRAEDEANEAGQELVKAQNRSAYTELRAPIDGVVDQLSVHSLNGVVTPAEHLMIIVPDRSVLMIEARLANRDVGFVHAGQAAKVKVETFNFTRYGLLDGRVVNVSRDTVADNDAEAPQGVGAGTAAPRPVPASPAYIARIALARDSMMIDGHLEPLQPGMSITAEIKTGQRTIADFLFSPIARRAADSLHER